MSQQLSSRPARIPSTAAVEEVPGGATLRCRPGPGRAAAAGLLDGRPCGAHVRAARCLGFLWTRVVWCLVMMVAEQVRHGTVAIRVASRSRSFMNVQDSAANQGYPTEAQTQRAGQYSDMLMRMQAPGRTAKKVGPWRRKRRISSYRSLQEGKRSRKSQKNRSLQRRTATWSVMDK